MLIHRPSPRDVLMYGAHSRRPGVGAGRRIGFRGVGGGAGAADAADALSLPSSGLTYQWAGHLGVTLDGSSRVENWTDHTGGEVLTQATEANRPIVEARSAGGTARDAIRFRAANVEWLRGTSIESLSAPHTAYLVCELETGSGSISPVTSHAGTVAAQLVWSTSAWTGNSGAILTSADGTKTGVKAIAFVTNGASSAIYSTDFATASASGAGGTNAFSSCTVGANSVNGNPIDGYIWLFALYSGAHDASQRAAVAAAINAFYGTSIT